jgi:hypothetical protein
VSGEAQARAEEAAKLAAIDAIRAAGERAIRFATVASAAAEGRAKDFEDVLAAELAVEAAGLCFAAEMLRARVRRLLKGRE